MVRLFRSQIPALVLAREEALAARRAGHPDRDVFEDREIEVLNETAIVVDAQIEAVARALDG